MDKEWDLTTRNQNNKPLKKAKKWQKSDEKKKITNKKKGNNNTGGGSSNKTSGPKTPSGFVRDKGRLYSVRSAQGKRLMNKLKAKKRAQEMARKRLANK